MEPTQGKMSTTDENMQQFDQIQEELSLDKLSSGDRPSLYALGFAASQALKQTKSAVLMVDALGRVRLMSSDSVKVLKPPRIEDDELNSLDEDQAIHLLSSQGDTEAMILEYLSRRKSVEG
jgi:hypothetical protein